MNVREDENEDRIGVVSGPFVSIAAFYFHWQFIQYNGYYKSSFHALPNSQGASREHCWRAISSNSIARVFESFN